MALALGLSLGLGIPGGIIIGIIIGFAIGQKQIKKQLKENPPMSREQVKAFYAQTGRTLSEQDLNRVMENMKKGVK